MRQTLLAAAAAFIIGGATVGSVLSYAQPAPPPPPGPPGVEAGWNHPQPGWMAWRHHWREGRGPIQPGTFALIFHEKDRNLAPADVQKVAEAFLLWHGNHTWKVVNVAPTPDGAIGFALATPNGDVIAKFTMDPHTGHVTRVG
ncbi:MAG TPA: hypothetical protein VGG99_05660 [Acetobacteraceae bacterium]